MNRISVKLLNSLFSIGAFSYSTSLVYSGKQQISAYDTSTLSQWFRYRDSRVSSQDALLR